MRAIHQYLFFILFVFLSHVMHGQISGVVFRDFNANGVKDNTATYNEPFVQGVTVTAYPSSGGIQTTTTNASGAYSFTGLTLPVRLEFSGYATSDFSAPVGGGNKSSVQFYSAPTTTANFGVNYPADYSSTTNPPVATSIFINGNSQTSGSTGTSVGLVSFPYNTGAVNTLSNLANIGAVWGLAYHKQSGKLFSAAFGKRHVSWGPLGPNGLYVTPNAKTANSAGASTSFVNLNTVNSGFDAGSVVRNFNPGQGSPGVGTYDENMFDAVGKVGIGDIDVSDDGMYLYAINLNDRKLWRIEVGVTGVAPTSASQVESYSAFPNPCTNSTFRPFAVKYYRGDIYIGGVCDGVNGSTSTSPVDRNNLKATIYKVSGSDSPGGATFTQVFTFPLTFNRSSNLNVGGLITSATPYEDPNGTINTLSQASWHPWSRLMADLTMIDAAAFLGPQPMLMDIEFDIDGSMILGFGDRTGHQGGYLNLGTNTSSPQLYYTVCAGDLYRVNNNSGTFVLENNGTAGSITTGGAGDGDGPGGGEYYFHDNFSAPWDLGNPTNRFGIVTPAANHDETSIGGLALMAGNGNVLQTVFDPLSINDVSGGAHSGGVRWYSNTDGTATEGITLYTNATPGGLGKASGLGDVELLIDLPPIEIGNRIWTDTDSDGIQDAGETPIQGVTVQLVNSGGTVIATATTDSNGNYYFSNATGTSTTSVIYNISGLQPNAQYTVRIPNVQGGSKQAALGTNVLTTVNAGGGTPGTQADVRDSDGTIVGNNAEVTVLTADIPVSGANNHTFDFGFVALVCVPPTATAAGTNPTCTGGIAQSNGTITINGFTTGERYQYSTGSTFNSGSAIPATITAIPVGGVIVNNLPNTTLQYTVRIYDPTDDACYVDRVVSITAATCGTCNCQEYVYLNDVVYRSTEKFSVDPTGMTRIGMPWLDWTSLGLSGSISPHGLGTDLNGYLYIAQDFGGPMRKFTCEGTMVGSASTPVSTEGSFNIVSYNEYIYTNSVTALAFPADYQVHITNTCTGALTGTITLLGSGAAAKLVWGMARGADGYVYASNYDGKIWRWMEGGSFDPNGNNNIPVYIDLASILTTANLGPNFEPLGNDDVYGIDVDAQGYIYIYIQGDGGNGGINDYSYLLKIDPAGPTIISQQSFINNTPLSNPGPGAGRGLVLDDTNGRVYVAGGFPGVADCLSAFDLNLNYLPAFSVPHEPGQFPKAIAMSKECCPVNLPTSFQKEVCGVPGTKFFLNEVAFNDCDGIVCGSTWTPVGTLTNMTYDACENSVTVTGEGCGTFTLSTGAGSNPSCIAQMSTFTICNMLPSATVTPLQGTCSGSNPNNDASINITAVVNGDQAGISIGSTYSGPVYSGVGTISITGGTGSFAGLAHNTTYTVRIYNGSNDCYADYTVTTPTVTCCALTVVCTPQPQTNCTPVNGSASVTASNAVGAVTYIWSTSETTSSISNKMAGTYTVTVTDTGLAGCVRTCSANITNNTVTPSAICSKTDNTNCTTPNGMASVSTNAPNLPNPTFVWSTTPTQTTSSISNLAAGTYTVTVTNTFNGCTNTCEAIIVNATVNPTCSIIANSQPSCANLTGGSITVTPSPAGTYSYAWSDSGPNTATRTGLTGGTYTVTVTNTTTNCTGVCNITLTTPTNCCNINAVTIQNVVCNDNSTPGIITDNRLVINALVTNTNASLTSYNATVSGGTTISPSTNIPYGAVQFTLGPGTAGGGATFTVTLTDIATPGCTQTFTVTDPGNCPPATQCPTPQCGTATIQVNGN